MKTAILNVRMEASEYKALADLAKKQERSVAVLVRKAIKMLAEIYLTDNAPPADTQVHATRKATENLARGNSSFFKPGELSPVHDPAEMGRRRSEVPDVRLGPGAVPSKRNGV